MPGGRVVRSLLALACATVAALGLMIGSSASAAPSVYHEPYRPQFHFTPRENWMNDPNGPIYYQGQYHLFYQYNPSGTTWGNISWGHAVSPDLVHWKQLPLAIPQDDSEYIFSGSVVYDKTNSSGFGTAADPPLVAIYTSAQKAPPGIQEQALAYSTDGGTTWTKYVGNPVLNLNLTNFRDPKVFWYAPDNDWVMVVALSDQHKVSIYTSTDLKAWTHQSDFGPAGAVGGVWECPNLFPLKVKGTNQTKWVLVVGINPGSYAGGSGDQYFVGNFDGTTFTSDDPVTYTPPVGTTLQGFDAGTYAPWTVTGSAFGSAPATGPLSGQSAVDGIEGSGFADSFTGGDAATGMLSSPTFTVTSPYLNFKIGGGNHPHVPGSVVQTQPPPGTTFADFEGSTYGDGWTETGDFVGTGPVAGAIDGQQAVSGYLGEKLVNTFFNGDLSTGTITSPAFTINSDYIDMLVGGGDHPDTGTSYPAGEGPTAVNLIVDGQVVDTATGPNNEALNWQSWNVSALQGKQAQIQIVDQNTGGWGHINVDNIVMASQAADIQNTETAVDLLVNGTVVDSRTGSNAEALDWASFDLRPYAGQLAQIQILDENTGGWGHINADQFSFADAPALSSVQRAHWVDYGADYYAATSFNDLPNGRQILIGWMNNWNYANAIPTSPWRSADSIPRELGLDKIGGRLQLTETPVSELSTLDTRNPKTLADKPITGTTSAGIQGPTLDLDETFAPGSATQFGIDVHVGSGQLTRIGYDRNTNTVFIDRTKSGNVSFDPTFASVQSAPLALRHGQLQLRILVDTSSVEVFADKGQVVLTDQIFPDPTSNGVDLFATGGTATLVSSTGRHLKSIWPR